MEESEEVHCADTGGYQAALRQLGISDCEFKWRSTAWLCVFLYSHSAVQVQAKSSQKLDRSRGGILASKQFRGREKPGSLVRGQGNVYNDCPRNLNRVRREMRTSKGAVQ